MVRVVSQRVRSCVRMKTVRYCSSIALLSALMRRTQHSTVAVRVREPRCLSNCCTTVRVPYVNSLRFDCDSSTSNPVPYAYRYGRRHRIPSFSSTMMQQFGYSTSTLLRAGLLYFARTRGEPSCRAGSCIHPTRSCQPRGRDLSTQKPPEAARRPEEVYNHSSSLRKRTR